MFETSKITTSSDVCPDSAIARQHIQIEALVEALHTRFEAGKKVTRNLVSLLNSLTAHLEMHFEMEEEHGYFEELIQRAPRLSDHVNTLLKQHSELLSESCKLVEIARKAFADDVESLELLERFKRFRLKLLGHEKAEIDLLQEAYTRDLGSKD